MTSDDTINKYLRDVLVYIIDDVDYLVIKADQNSPRPKVPYCTVKITSSRSASLEEFSFADEGLTDSKITTKAMRTLRVAFDFFKKDVEDHDPFYVAGLCRQALSRLGITSMLSLKGLGLAIRSQVKNLTFELDNGFEERAHFIATFNFVDIDEEVTTTINAVEVTGEYQSNGRIEPMVIDINN